MFSSGGTAVEATLVKDTSTVSRMGAVNHTFPEFGSLHPLVRDSETIEPWTERISYTRSFSGADELLVPELTRIH
jgi:hypothetical protein